MNLTISSPQIACTTDLGEVVCSYQFDTAAGSSGAVTLQLFVQRTGDTDWQDIGPGAQTVLTLADGAQNRGSWRKTLPKGDYTGGNLILFVAGTGYSQTAFQQNVPVAFAIATSQTRVTKPTIEISQASVMDKVHVPVVIKFPKNWRQMAGYTDAGFWAMVKGSAGFQQAWAAFGDGDANVKQGTDPFDDYARMDLFFDLSLPTAPGLYNLQPGLFKASWEMLCWAWPGFNFDSGDWVDKGDPSRYPRLADALAPLPGLPLTLGGNYGNAINWTITPENNSAAFFRLLANIGLKVLRVNYNADLALNEPAYSHQVQQVAYHMLQGGLVPCLAPQELPAGATMADRENNLVTLSTRMAQAFAGLPVILDVLNEPHQYGTWAAWKPVAQRCCEAIRAASPHAYITVGFEGYSKDGRAASADPLPDGLCDVYGWHPYLPAEQIVQAAGTLPVAAWEYHDGSPEFHAALTQIPNLKLIAAWAWTTPGQDEINLLDSTAGGMLTPGTVGLQILRCYHQWQMAETLPAPAPTSTPPPDSAAHPVTGATAQAPTPSGLTSAQVQAIADSEITLHLADVQALTQQEQALSSQVQDLAARLAAAEAKITAAEAKITAVSARVDRFKAWADGFQAWVMRHVR